MTAANYVRSAGMAIDARTVLVGDSEGTRGSIVGVSQIKTIKVESKRSSIKQENLKLEKEELES
jgi:hypothetical protein